MPLSFSNLFSVNKLDYIKKRRERSACVLCEIGRGGGRGVRCHDLSVAAGESTAVCVNKYPYNSGHILIFPKRHVTDYRDLTAGEEREISLFLRKSLDVLDSLYAPSGYNIGYNLGDFAGASIGHLHMHVIPRYRNELGFVDIVGGAKILVEDPLETMRRLRRAFGTGV